MTIVRIQSNMKYERGGKEINIEEESGLCQRESSRAIRCVTDEEV